MRAQSASYLCECQAPNAFEDQFIYHQVPIEATCVEYPLPHGIHLRILLQNEDDRSENLLEVLDSAPLPSLV